jgi:hypothetical protein
MTFRLPHPLCIAFLAWLVAGPVFAQKLPSNAPVPTERPGEPTAETTIDNLPPIAPLPSPPPELASPETKGKEGNPAKPEPVATPVPPDTTPPATELACRKQLRELGATFRETEISAPSNGCALPFPVELSKLSADTEVKSAVTLNCATALASTKFLRDVIQPVAKEILGAPVKSIQQASGYVCRPRNGTTKLSEHAFGNALDIASFTLTTGEVVEVKPAPPDKHEKFLRRVRDAACGPFKTVLGPGSNADHALHLHFDLAQRRNRGTYCK